MAYAPAKFEVTLCYVQQFRRKYIYKKIHYLTFDLDLGAKVKQNIAQYPLHHLDLGVKVKQNIAQYPPHHVTYAHAKIEVDTSHGLGDAFTRNLHYLSFYHDLGVKVPGNVDKKKGEEKEEE